MQLRHFQQNSEPSECSAQCAAQHFCCGDNLKYCKNMGTLQAVAREDQLLTVKKEAELLMFYIPALVSSYLKVFADPN